MAQLLSIKHFKGLQLAADVRKISDPFVLNGKNFLMDLDGPYSGLGRTLIAYKAIKNPTNVQVFEIADNDESIILTNDAIWQLDTESGRLVLLYELAVPITVEFPWSMAAVGNRFYFARPGTDLIEYDPYEGTWGTVTSASLPTNIYSVAESEGRLIALTPLIVSWSVIGDALDHIGSTITGAGAQVLSKLGKTNPTVYGVKKVPDGFLTFCSSGIMKSQAIDSIVTYRHTVLSYKHAPINPYCLIETDDQAVIFLAKSGLYKTAGQQPVEYQPLMSEFLHTRILPSLDIKNNQNNIQLTTDFDRSWFVISVAQTQENYLYTIAYILNTKTDEWGVLNDAHVAVENFRTVTSLFEGFPYGFINTEGSIFHFDGSTGIEYIPELAYGLYYYHPVATWKARIEDGIYIFPTVMRLTTVDESLMSACGVYNIYHTLTNKLSPSSIPATELDSELVGSIYQMKSIIRSIAGFQELQTVVQNTFFNPLNSYVDLGLFRLNDEQYPDTLTYITNVKLGMLDVAAGSIKEDWADEILYPIDIIKDWLTASEDEDWGSGGNDAVDYDLNLYGTIDGTNQIEDVTPELALVYSKGKSRMYAAYSTGVYHYLNVSALNANQNYALKVCDLTFTLGGRYV